jgi:hypothetical protein
MSRMNAVLCLTLLFVVTGAASAQSYTCIATVATDGGKATLGTTSVTGSPIAVAASACHDFTRKAFAANLNWSDPAKLCSRYASGTVRRVEAIDNFKEVGTPGNYNRVGGYTVVCNGPTSVTQLPTAPEVVQR